MWGRSTFYVPFPARVQCPDSSQGAAGQTSGRWIVIARAKIVQVCPATYQARKGMASEQRVRHNSVGMARRRGSCRGCWYISTNAKAWTTRIEKVCTCEHEHEHDMQMHMCMHMCMCMSHVHALAPSCTWLMLMHMCATCACACTWRICRSLCPTP